LPTALLIGFAACLLVLVPPQLLHPDWQWRFIGILTDNRPLAVVAFGLLHLAAYIDSQNDRLQGAWRPSAPGPRQQPSVFCC
jgi:hypothetical protein